MNRIFLTTAALAALGSFGTALAQDSKHEGPHSATGNAQNEEMMTCADLNEMDETEAIAFLRGYQYAQTAANRSGGSGADTATTTSTSGTSTSQGSTSETSTGETSTDETGKTSTGETSTGATSTSTEVGTAVTTGDVTGGVGTEAKGPEAILTSCFDVPTATLDEVLSGPFGTVN